MRIWIRFGFVLLGLLWLTGCNQPPGASFGMKLQLLNEALYQQIEFVDIAFFESKEDINCSTINHNNYNETDGDFAEEREKLSSLFFKANTNFQLKDIPVDETLVVYAVALRSENNQKIPIASGCQSDITFQAGKYTDLKITLKEVQ